MNKSRFRSLVGPIYVINLSHRTDRWRECCLEFSENDINQDEVVRFEAVPSNIHGSIGCAYSHAAVLMRFLLESDEPHCLVLEDDFKFILPMDHVVREIESVILSSDVWDALLLAGNMVFSFETRNPSIVRVYESLTTSAYIIKREAAPKLIERFLTGANRLKEILPVLARNNWGEIIKRYSADVVWHQLQMTDPWFMLNPRVVVQRPSFSDIMLEHVDYKV
jgi:glycosyl transferase family 25